MRIATLSLSLLLAGCTVAKQIEAPSLSNDSLVTRCLEESKNPVPDANESWGFYILKSGLIGSYQRDAMLSIQNAWYTYDSQNPQPCDFYITADYTSGDLKVQSVHLTFDAQTRKPRQFEVIVWDPRDTSENYDMKKKTMYTWNVSDSIVGPNAHEQDTARTIAWQFWEWAQPDIIIK